MIGIILQTVKAENKKNPADIYQTLFSNLYKWASDELIATE